MKRYFYGMAVVLAGVVALSGCAKLSHLNELLTLQDLSKEQEAQEQYVQAQDRNFEYLLEEFKGQKIEQYRNKKGVLKAFGDPVLKTQVSRNGETIDRWLYRYAIHPMESDKIYLYFGAREKLIAWEWFPAGQNEKNGSSDTSHTSQVE